jgi:hypothetical protein
VTERRECTAQGYRRFRRRSCGKQFNERSGTLLNHAHYPFNVNALVVLCPSAAKRRSTNWSGVASAAVGRLARRLRPALERQERRILHGSAPT